MEPCWSVLARELSDAPGDRSPGPYAIGITGPCQRFDLLGSMGRRVLAVALQHTVRTGSDLPFAQHQRI